MNSATTAAPDNSVLDSTPVPPEGFDADASNNGETPDARHLHRKIARLPKPLRDLINSMLDDAASAQEIIHKLSQSTDPPLPYPINKMDISRWKRSGYLRYLARQERLDRIQINREDAREMVNAGDTATLPEATLQMIASQYYEFLGDFNLEALKQKLADDPLKCTRFFNVFSRITREIMHIRKYRDALAHTNAAVAQPTGPTRSPTAEEICSSFLVGFEKVHGIKPADAPIGPDLNNYPTESAPVLRSAPDEGGSASSSFSSSSSPSIDRTQDIPSPGARPTFGGEPRPVRSASPPSISLAKEGDEGRDERELIKSPTESPPQSKIENQNSKIETSTPPPPQPAELCYSCSVPLPPLKPDGTRPSRTCPGCQIRLYPPDTTFDHCPVCDAFQAILPGGERNSSACERCHQTLPPPGQRYLAQCPGCGIQLKNFDMHGNRIVERCRNCLTPLPLLEPIPDPNQNSNIETPNSGESPPLAAAA